jgi:hypothetical protein
MLFVVIGTSTCSPNTCYQIEYKIKIVKSAKFYVTSGVQKRLKCSNIKRSIHFLVWRICISSWWSGWSSKFCGLLIHQRCGDRAVGSEGFLSYACYCLSLLRGWCVVYVSDASGHISYALWAIILVLCYPYPQQHLKHIPTPNYYVTHAMRWQTVHAYSWSVKDCSKQWPQGTGTWGFIIW